MREYLSCKPGFTERFDDGTILHATKKKKHLKKRRLEMLKENNMREYLSCKPGFTERFDDGTILHATKKKKHLKKRRLEMLKEKENGKKRFFVTDTTNKRRLFLHSLLQWSINISTLTKIFVLQFS